MGFVCLCVWIVSFGYVVLGIVFVIGLLILFVVVDWLFGVVFGCDGLLLMGLVIVFVIVYIVCFFVILVGGIEVGFVCILLLFE